MPEQIVTLAGVIETAGNAFTVIAAVAEDEHPDVVPVTVYVMVTVGDAVTVEPVVALSDVAGDHVYVVAPLAVRVLLLPAQMAEVAGVTVTVGVGVTVIVEDADAVHPAVVPVTV